MSEFRPAYNDEISLFEFFEILWDGKWLISVCIGLALLIGFGYTQVVTPTFMVTVPYTINLYSVYDQQLCGANIACIHSEESKRLKALLNSGWNNDTSNNNSAYFFTITTRPSTVGEYVNVFKNYNKLVTNDILENSYEELKFIRTDMNNALLRNDSVARNVLNAKRLVNAIKGGELIFSFGLPSISKRSPRSFLILVASFSLGAMIGVFITLVRNAIRKRKEQLATT